MLSRFLPALLGPLLQALVLGALSLSLAHAADSPGFFDSLSKLVPASELSSAAPAASRGTLPAAGQGRRIALVIGNSDYKHSSNLPTLANPAHDAEDIAEALRGFGFEVIERKNLTLEGMNQAVADFGSKIGGSEAALFYFAGHGIQVKNQNYLMPVGAKIESEAAVPFQGFNVNQVLEEMDNGKSVANIVMLDACRNNPISGKFRSGASRGLASPGITPQGTVIVYATDPGNVAADGEGRNGLFSAGLLSAFKGADLSLDGVLTLASEYVERKSIESDPAHKQTPYVNGPKTLQKNFHFRVTVEPSTAEIEKTFWVSIERSTDVADFEAYIRKYPNGNYRALAENQIKRLRASQQAAPSGVMATPPVAALKSDDPEMAFWKEAKTSGEREYLSAYLKQYPNGKYFALAKIELKKLDDRDQAERLNIAAEKKQAAERERLQAIHVEQAAWDDAKANKSVAAYTRYLEDYPNGRYAALAKVAKQKMQREESEREKQLAAHTKRAQADEAKSKLASVNTKDEVRTKFFKDCDDCPEMIELPGGTIAFGKTPITQGQWRAIMGNSPSFFKDCGDDCPVEQVSWNDTQAYLKKVNDKTGRVYRLPTAAEWRDACQAGTRHDYCGSNNINEIAWYGNNGAPGGNSNQMTHPVGRKLPNAWGLVDMTGNVWTWLQDCQDGDCGRRILLGGSWDSSAIVIKSSQLQLETWMRIKIAGFRIVRALP